MSVCVLKMEWKRNSFEGRGNGYSHIWTIVIMLEMILATHVLTVASEGDNTRTDAIAEGVSNIPQVCFIYNLS
jgi:hypothetical protein